MLKKMEQAKKKAEAVVNTVDISEREKMAQLKRLASTSTRPLRFIPSALKPNYFLFPSFTASTRRPAWERRSETSRTSWLRRVWDAGCTVPPESRALSAWWTGGWRKTQELRRGRSRGGGAKEGGAIKEGVTIKEGGAWRQEKDMRIRSDGHPSRPHSVWLIELLVSFMGL